MSRTLALLLILSSIPAAAQSFNCKLATTPREHAVCANTRLRTLDAELAANYKSLRTQLSPESAVLVQSDQREWLRWIDLDCPAHGKGIADNQSRCLQSEYLIRLHNFQHLTRIGNTVIFLRSHWGYKPAAKSDEGDTPDDDPGYGDGSLLWPQIDRPNEAQSAFNAAVQARAARLAVGFDDDPNATFDTAVDPSGSIDADYTIEAANNRFIDVTLTDVTSGWRAAHPSTDSTSFLWWLDRNRELTAADVFLPNSGWKDQLATLAEKNLRSQPDLKDDALGDDIHNKIYDTAIHPDSWTLTRDGLTITFGQYAIGAYAIGMPQAHVSWTDLKPFLQPTLNPSTLPPPEKRPKP